MSQVEKPENKKLERNQRKEKHYFQGEGKGVQVESHPTKKASSNRHSYHQGSNNNYSPGQYPFEFQNFAQMEGGMELQRQRSFVLPGQLHHQTRENQYQQRKRSSPMPATQRGKPAMEIYRPPTLRDPNVYANGEAIFNGIMTNGFYDIPGSSTKGNVNGFMNKPGLNIHAKEFISGAEPSSIQHSKSSGNIMVFQHQRHGGRLQHSKSGHHFQGVSNSLEATQNINTSSPPRVHFRENKENEPDAKNDGFSRPPSLAPTPCIVVGGNPVKRSKSLGAADLRNAFIGDRSPLSDIGPFAQEVHNNITKAMNDPNTLSARHLMDVVRHVFTRVVEASRYAEPTARLCIAIIEKEKSETLLETLLNTCQEYFHERARLLRSATPAPYPGYVCSHPRWIAYMSFLNEMYTQLKRRHVQLMTRQMKNSETAPGLLLLTLLAQCCHVCLREQAVNSLAETECLFFVLTAVGNDIEVEIPQQMARVMGAARDAFLTTVHVPAVKKTLLQLIEMYAARWQLPASAVMYYYPGSGNK